MVLGVDAASDAMGSAMETLQGSTNAQLDAGAQRFDNPLTAAAGDDNSDDEDGDTDEDADEDDAGEAQDEGEGEAGGEGAGLEDGDVDLEAGPAWTEE